MPEFKIPRYLREHHGVDTVEDAPSVGFPDYRYHVWLKNGWCWERGRNAQGASLNFNNKADFDHAHPVLIEEQSRKNKE